MELSEAVIEPPVAVSETAVPGQAAARSRTPRARGEGWRYELNERARTGLGASVQAARDTDHMRQHGRRRKEGAVGGGEDGASEFASRRASAIAVRLPKVPGCTSTSPASGSKSKLKTPCSGTREPRKAETSGGTSRRLGCTTSSAQRARSS
eukprot:6180549-Pleurochrysis_carterae.AAC.1